jgi:hypothetical protein
MKSTLFLLLAMIALTACEVDAAPSTDGGPGTVINPTAALEGYPGASNSDVIPDGLDTRTFFESDASLGEIYDHFHTQLTAQGWQRTDLETDDDEIEPEYRRDGRELELELERDDGGFELEIDIDRDNSSYDQDNGAGDDDDDTDDDDGRDD